jgi:pimeloyl-ACP methyl ester carboxylesterase
VQVVAACADELGARRAHYRTEDSVADLEALRAESGYERLVLYGVSYGTKVALDYAARYPSRVERLVLDSVVPPEGPDPLLRSSFTAARRILREQCAARRCRGVTPDPIGDIRRLMRRDRIRGTYIDGRGRRRSAEADAGAIYRAYLVTDLNPAWRAQLAGAARAAVRGDATPLLRTLAQTIDGPTGSQSAETATRAVPRHRVRGDPLSPWSVAPRSTSASTRPARRSTRRRPRCTALVRPAGPPRRPRSSTSARDGRTPPRPPRSPARCRAVPTFVLMYGAAEIRDAGR